MHTALLLVTLGAATPDAGSDRTMAMHQALDALVRLQPALASPRVFAEAATGPRIVTDLEALSRVEHGFLSARPTDPGSQGIARVLTLQVARARQALGRGETETARSLLRGTTSMCFTCHTLASASHEFASPQSPTASVELTALERATFLAATRHFDEALGLWLTTLAQPATTEQEATDAIHGLREAIAVSVAVKDDPAKTLQLIDSQKKSGGQQAFYAARWSEAWRGEAMAWQRERFESRSKSPQQLFARAKALIDESGAAQHILADETKTVSLLRATAYLTQAIAREPQASWRPEALWALGVATATVRDPMLWGLDAVYFEACIRENPGTAIAQRCLTILSDRTIFGFTGSSGTHLPPEVEGRLRQLSTLAAPKQAPSRPQGER